MKVILLADVKSQGKKGDVIEASDGYARNFLFPKKLAVEATAKNLNEIKLKKANDQRIAARDLEVAKGLAEKIEKTSVSVSLKAGEGGKTFGSISSKEIAEALKAQRGIEIDKKKMNLSESIRSLGTYSVPIRLHPEVAANLTVNVEAK